MEKDLATLFPNIFVNENEQIKIWKLYQSSIENLKLGLAVAEKAVLEKVKENILSTVDDPILKFILLQKTVLTGYTVLVIEAIIERHLNFNGKYNYCNTDTVSQLLVLEKLKEIENLLQKSFLIKELNLRIWLRPRPNNKEDVILHVGKWND